MSSRPNISYHRPTSSNAIVFSSPTQIYPAGKAKDPNPSKDTEPIFGKNGARYFKHGAFCLETQNYPDAVNHVRHSITFFLSISMLSFGNAIGNWHCWCAFHSIVEICIVYRYICVFFRQTSPVQFWIRANVIPMRYNIDSALAPDRLLKCCKDEQNMYLAFWFTVRYLRSIYHRRFTNKFIEPIGCFWFS